VIPTGVTISDLNVTMNIAHSWVSDLTITLISPAGIEVKLLDGACDDANDISATFNDGAMQFVCGNNPAISGTVGPLEQLSAFNGQNSAGTWTLRVKDNYSQDGGSLNSWSLTICNTEVALATPQNQLAN